MIAEQTSPGGLLTICIERYDTDISIGFLGLPWHTHGSVLAELQEQQIESAVSIFVEKILSDGNYICVLRDGGRIVDAWIVDNPLEVDVNPGEDLEVRR